MDATLAALLGATIGGMLSVLASWIAQRVQSRSQWVVQETKQRQRLYSEFIQGSARCFADALQENAPDPGRLAALYGEIGQMRLHSSDAVVLEARQIAHMILQTYQDVNREKEEIRDLLDSGAVDLFSRFGDACRAELAGLNPHEARYLVRPELGAAAESRAFPFRLWQRT
jgi:superfamily I DNA/RNA helicase